jgi:hypothetical protein
MHPDTERAAASREVEEHWTRLLRDDEGGVDRDVETLVGVLQRRHGCGHDRAAVTLVRRLSVFSDQRGVGGASDEG